MLLKLVLSLAHIYGDLWLVEHFVFNVTDDDHMHWSVVLLEISCRSHHTQYQQHPLVTVQDLLSPMASGLKIAFFGMAELRGEQWPAELWRPTKF